MMPSKVFGSDALEHDAIIVAPPLPPRSAEYCWSCGSKLESGAIVCHKCNKACTESDVCCGRPLPPAPNFCRRCGTQRAVVHWVLKTNSVTNVGGHAILRAHPTFANAGRRS